ncbi:hypothetical protein [Haloferula sargassicola]
MRILLPWLAAAVIAQATTLSVVPIHEPISMRATDVDDLLDESEEALQATVMPRPMALSGAFPETLVEAIATPHQLPTNDPHYVVEEVNLLILCHVKVAAEMKDDGLYVTLDVGGLEIPEDVDLTSRQLVRLAMLAVRRTLEDYQRPQTESLKVRLLVAGTSLETESLKDLATEYVLKGS